MTAKAVFKDARTLLERVDRNIVSFETLFIQFMNKNIRMHIEPNALSGYTEIRLEMPNVGFDPLDELVGNTITDIKKVFEFSYRGLLLTLDPTHKKDTYFPWGTDLENVNKLLAAQPNLPQEMIDLIYAVEPYYPTTGKNGGDLVLRSLTQTVNENKHSQLISAQIKYNPASVNFHFDGTEGPIDFETRVFQDVVIDQPGYYPILSFKNPPSTLKYDTMAIYEPIFSKGTKLSCFSVTSVLNHCMSKARHVLNSMENWAEASE